MILQKNFYDRKTLKVAQDLLGCFLMRKVNGKTVKTMITETEAYCGPYDLASHASRGRTDRNEVMFGGPGMIYVYLIYGMYSMLNIVTEKEDYPAAVLIRGVAYVDNKNAKPLNGPGKLTKTLKIDKTFNKLPVYTKKHGLWIEEGIKIKKSRIKRDKRVGVDYAGEYRNKLWRLYLE